MKNKFLALILTGILTLSLVACGSKEEAPESNSESVVSEESSSETEEAAPKENVTETEENIAEPEETETSSMTLEDILNSDEMKTTITEGNENLKSTGFEMTYNLVADGNVLVYEYSLPDNDTCNNYTEDDIADLVDFFGGIDQIQTLAEQMFDYFERDFGFSLEGFRLVYNKADGTTIYSTDITKE